VNGTILITVYGMKRGGQHGFSNWLMSQFRDGYGLYLNDRELFGDPLVVRYYDVWGDFCSVPLSKIREVEKDVVIVGMEDKHMTHIVSRDVFPGAFREKLGPITAEYSVLLIRDPFNLFASRKRWVETRGRWLGRNAMDVELWKEHAREYLGLTNHLPAKPIRLCYNFWYLSEAYRRAICSLLGIEGFSDDAFTAMSLVGNNTWDGVKYRGKTSLMPVLSRWKHYKLNREYMSLFDGEVLEFAERIFVDGEGGDVLVEVNAGEVEDV